MIIAGDLTVQGHRTGVLAGSQPADLALFGDIQTNLAALFQGVWSAGRFYYLGQWVTRNGAIYRALQDNTGAAPESSADKWLLLLAAAAGAAGASSYTYLAYASDASGTGFTTTFNAALDYVAIKTTTSPLTSPAAGDFAGLWKNYKGATGGTGTPGSAGASSYTYLAYASDASGTGFTTAFNASLDYVAIKTTTSPLTSPAAGDFAGLWKNYKGAAGTNGTNGTPGASSYTYLAYASDASGTGFTTTFNASLDYLAIKTTTSPISGPQASDFAGLWKNYKGATGATGTPGSAGANAYVYIAYASDASGTGFTTTFNGSLNYLAIKTTTTAIVTPQASDFAGLWKNYGGQALSVSGAPLTLTGGVLGLNAASAATANYLVQRDSNGSFAANKLLLGGTTPAADHLTLAGTGTLGYYGSLFTFNAGLSAPSLTLGAFNWAITGGALQLTHPGTGHVVAGYDGTALTVYALILANQSAGFVRCDADGVITAGAATADDLPEKSTSPVNLYFTRARVLATPLAGLNPSVGGTLAAADTLLGALGKVENRLASLESNPVPAPPLTIGNFKVDASGNVLLKFPDATWHRIVLTQSQGQYVWDIGQTAE